MDIAEVVQTILMAILNSPEAVAVLVTFILAVIPGPFKGLAQTVINWLLERLRNSMETQREAKADAIAALAVRNAQDIKNRLIASQVPDAGSKALDEALIVARQYGLFNNDPQGEARIRAKYQELKASGGLVVAEEPPVSG